MRSSALLFVLVAVFVLAAAALGDPVSPVQPVAPTPAVGMGIDQAHQLRRQRQYSEALAAAVQALAAAHDLQDQVGEAWARREMACALEALGRPGEARAAWEAAERGFAAWDDGPARVDAYCHLALLSPPGA